MIQKKVRTDHMGLKLGAKAFWPLLVVKYYQASTFCSILSLFISDLRDLNADTLVLGFHVSKNPIKGFNRGVDDVNT